MTAQRSGGEVPGFDSKVRARRPQPTDELIDRLTSRARTSPGAFMRSLRLAGTATFLAILTGALAASGALGYAGSVIQESVSQVERTVSSGPETVVDSPADSITGRVRAAATRTTSTIAASSARSRSTT